MDSAELDFNLRKEFGDWDDNFDEFPVDDSFATYGEFELVGHGKVTNGFCGKFSKVYGCSRKHLHNRITLDGVNYSGMGYFKPVFNSCDKPSCPVCYKFGWAIREARKIEARLAESSKRFGLAEHIVCSVPVKDYGLSYEALRSKAVKVLKVRGVVGGCLIFHGFRYNLVKHWYWSPHFHVLGHILGGYRCRGCKRKSNCLKGCGGFDDRTWQAFQKDGYYVKVLGKRKSVYHTAWYQLNHSSVKRGVVRFHVATWFGVCSYRKLKVTVEFKKRVCPICKHELVEHFYCGRKPDVLAVLRSDRDSCGKREFFADIEENGCRAWVECVKS